MPSRIALKKFMAWMAFVKADGWPKETWSGLADLWWQHHNEETGELV